MMLVDLYEVFVFLLCMIITVKSQFSAEGCYSNQISLDCRTQVIRSIIITGGVFAVDNCWNDPPGFCCPNVSRPDCTIPISQADPDYYSSLEQSCNGLDVCIIVVNRTDVPNICIIGTVSNYTNSITVDYSCADAPTTIPPTTIQPTTIQPTTVSPTTETITTKLDLTTVPQTTGATNSVTTMSTTTISTVDTATPSNDTTVTQTTITMTDITTNLYSTSSIKETTEPDFRETSTHGLYYTTADPCPEEIPFYLNWIFLGPMIAVVVLLLIILILGICLCKANSANKKAKSSERELDDEGGFRRNPSFTNYNRQIRHQQTRGDYAKEQNHNANTAAVTTSAAPTSPVTPSAAAMGLYQAPDTEMDRYSEDSGSINQDSFDNTVASSDSEADLVKRQFEDQPVSELNAIRVFPQNTTDSLNTRGNSAAAGPSNDREVVSTFRTSSGMTLPGHDNRNSTPVVTQNDGPSQRPSFNAEFMGASSRQSSARSRLVPPEDADSFRLDTSSYELERRASSRGASKEPPRDPPHIRPPPPPSIPPPDEESPDDLIPRRYPSASVKPPVSGATGPEPRYVTQPSAVSHTKPPYKDVISPSKLVLTKPKPMSPLQSRPTTDTGQPSSPQAAMALPVLRSSSSARENPDDNRGKPASSPPKTYQPTPLVVPYASRAIVKPVSQHEIHNSGVSPSQRAMSNDDMSSLSHDDRPPRYTPVDQHQQQYQPMMPMHQPRTQLHVQPPQQATRWLRGTNAQQSTGHSSEGFYV